MVSNYGFFGVMLEYLTSAYNRKDVLNEKKGRPPETNIGRLFKLVADGYEDIYENAELVKLWDDLDNAEGSVLDRHGANFGVSRGGASDDLYRIFIQVKMIAQLSGGDDASVLAAAAELLGVDLADVSMEDVFPAKKFLYVDKSLLTEERVSIIEQIAYAVKRTMLAGVGLRLYLRTHRSYSFHFTVSAGIYCTSHISAKRVIEGE